MPKDTARTSNTPGRRSTPYGHIAYADHDSVHIPFGQRRGAILRPPVTREQRELVHSLPDNLREARQKRITDFRANRALEHEKHAQQANQRDNEAERQQILAGPSKPTLEARLAALPPATYEPIASKSISIDFSKYTPADLAHIFAPKFSSTLKRLEVFETFEFGGEVEDTFGSQIRDLRDLIAKLFSISRGLSDKAAVITHAEWLAWEQGTREIGEVSFKGLRKNKVQILKALSAVYRRRF